LVFLRHVSTNWAIKGANENRTKQNIYLKLVFDFEESAKHLISICKKYFDQKTTYWCYELPWSAAGFVKSKTYTALKATYPLNMSYLLRSTTSSFLLKKNRAGSPKYLKALHTGSIRVAAILFWQSVVFWDSYHIYSDYLYQMFTSSFTKTLLQYLKSKMFFIHLFKKKSTFSAI